MERIGIPGYCSADAGGLIEVSGPPALTG